MPHIYIWKLFYLIHHIIFKVKYLYIIFIETNFIKHIQAFSP